MSHLLCEWCHLARRGLRRSKRHKCGMMATLPQHDSPQLVTRINSSCSGAHPMPGLTILQTSSFLASADRYSHSVPLQMVRFDPKSFAVRRPDGHGGWVDNLDGIPWVPYRLPAVLAAHPTELICIMEGEKDVKRLERAGLVATTNPFGAGKWRLEFSRYFTGRSVVILSDNDEEGERHAQFVADSLLSVAAWVKWVKLPELAPGGDVSDWLAAGKTVAHLRRLVEETAPLPPPEAVSGPTADDAGEAAADDNAVTAAADDPWSKALPAPIFMSASRVRSSGMSRTCWPVGPLRCGRLPAASGSRWWG